ncbi:ZIP-like iron-zinc transporter [Marasmius fiardii PR-910]|nr:ZIP-like iron-zinc transporter [Marasmius fiardii PR-910]
MLALIALSAILGAASFACGMLPLSLTLSKSYMSRLTLMGTGLLLGTALGVIIPEGLETLVEANPNSEIPSTRIALSLLIGFTFMLLVEQYTSHFSHHHHGYELPRTNPGNNAGSSTIVDFDAELDDLESEQGISQGEHSSSSSGDPSQAIPLTVGLVIHSIADGLALGVSFASESGAATGLSIIIFLAIIIHKLPTSLALTTSLLATSLPRPDCKKHLAAFSISTPLSAVATYAFMVFFGGKGNPTWTGTALLLSGGTFLYVATLVSQHTGPQGDDVSKPTRLGFIVLGMFTPFILSSLFGHGHD